MEWASSRERLALAVFTLCLPCSGEGRCSSSLGWPFSTFGYTKLALNPETVCNLLSQLGDPEESISCRGCAAQWRL